ncbi:dynein regulatory complex protein 1 [Megalops cyprinoides]|uniref:dynein regulatory complex protein 1 n=1 Tax=Megalops cyprinoides TaxID=118141 RepID=UPI001863BEE1|nr:dynein regulatory complex protein 1 [Megalops cyprinoides]
MSDAGDTSKEESGPSVESDNPQERIAARHQRIAQQIEAKHRKELGDDSEEDEQAEARESQKQVEHSEEHMIKLERDGTELLTNIETAADYRESQRRMEEEEARRLRVEKLENEAKSSLEKFEEITKKWTLAKEKEIPQDLRDALVSQQQLCALLIEDKNKLINDLQEELKASDNLYVKDLKRQGEDIDLMIERMEEQIKNLTKSYKQEFAQIESAFEKERAELLHKNRVEWERKMKERRDKEVEYLMQRMKKVEENEMMLEKLRQEDAEECNAIKTKLDTEVKVLQQQVQQMKATYQLNQEKLEYNLQVLKKRDEENTITKTQQKRKITRLQDALNNLKVRCAKQEQQAMEENQSIIDDYKRIVQENKHREKKMKHFATVDAKKFEEIWLMNETEVKGLVEKALEMDRMVHEQYLGLVWERPSMPFMERTGPGIQPLPTPKSVTESQREKAQEEAGPSTQSPKASASESAESGPGSVSGEGESTVSVMTVKRILELLCDEAGFLIDSKVLKLLAPLEKDEKSLVKLDIILSAIGVDNEEDMFKLAKFFIKYGQQRKESQEATTAERPQSEREGSSPVWELIHPNDVLAALRAFTAEHCKPKEKKQQSKILSLDQRDEAADAAFWEAAANVIPESKLKLWDTLETALDKYHTVLTERAQLLEETQHLKQQNEEMRRLLQKHVNSRVNAELLIPPTKVMQLQQE